MKGVFRMRDAEGMCRMFNTLRYTGGSVSGVRGGVLCRPAIRLVFSSRDVSDPPPELGGCTAPLRGGSLTSRLALSFNPRIESGRQTANRNRFA
jgi:hypothetical protein